jgi:hypothetical protein
LPSLAELDAKLAAFERQLDAQQRSGDVRPVIREIEVGALTNSAGLFIATDGDAPFVSEAVMSSMGFLRAGVPTMIAVESSRMLCADWPHVAGTCAFLPGVPAVRLLADATPRTLPSESPSSATPLSFGCLTVIENDFGRLERVPSDGGVRADFGVLEMRVIELIQKGQKYNTATLVNHMGSQGVLFRSRYGSPISFGYGELQWLLTEVIGNNLKMDQYFKLEFTGCRITHWLKKKLVACDDPEAKETADMIELPSRVGVVAYTKGREAIKSLLPGRSAKGQKCELGCGKSRMASRVLRYNKELSMGDLVAKMRGARLFASREFAAQLALPFYGICDEVGDLLCDESQPFSLCAATDVHISVGSLDEGSCRRPVSMAEFYARVWAKVSEVDGFDRAKRDEFDRKKYVSYTGEPMPATREALMRVGAGHIDLLAALSPLVRTRGDRLTAEAVCAIGEIYCIRRN